MSQRLSLFSDPVHGFVSVPRGTLYDLIATKEVQRLRRIRQLGVGYLVFPGAEHSRFGHALGAMALMHDTLASLAEKGTPISPHEFEAASAAALLHDIGHGPFSHTLEDTLISDFHHEAMSRVLLLGLERILGDRLEMTLAMFDDTYDRPFFHQLVSSQLDMDRLDYLRRDSYYTGVVEGQVGVARIIKTLRVAAGERLVIERKGLYAVESFLIARRLMYWQVYLHKTVLAGDHLLRSAIRRARDLRRAGSEAPVRLAAPAFGFFLTHDVSADRLSDPEVVNWYAALDDADILFTLKQWQTAGDPILRDLAGRFLERRLLRVAVVPDDHPVNEAAIRSATADWLVREGLSSRADAGEDASYYAHVGRIRHAPYERDHEPIVVWEAGGERELTAAADSDAIASLSRPEEKRYYCAPKSIDTAALA